MSTADERVLPESRHPVAGSPEPPPEGSPIRSPAQIERDIEARRQRLAGTVDAIADRVKPANVVQRQREQLVSRLQTAREQLTERARTGSAQVRERVSDPSGSVRPEVLGAAAGAVVLVVVVVVAARSRG